MGSTVSVLANRSSRLFLKWQVLLESELSPAREVSSCLSVVSSPLFTLADVSACTKKDERLKFDPVRTENDMRTKWRREEAAECEEARERLRLRIWWCLAQS